MQARRAREDPEPGGHRCEPIAIEPLSPDPSAAAAEVALKESMSQSMAMAAQEGFNFVYVHQSYILFAAASIGIFFYGDYASL